MHDRGFSGREHFDRGDRTPKLQRATLAEQIASEGDQIFRDFAVSTGYPADELDLFLSSEKQAATHTYLACLSSRSREEMTKKAVAVYASHLIDETVDAAAAGELRQRIKKLGIESPSLYTVFKSETSQLITTVIESATSTIAADRGFRRVIYGSLLAHEDGKDLQQSQQVYLDFSLHFLSAKLAHGIRQLPPAAFGLTNKTVQELFMAFEEPGQFNFELAELWSLAYAPLIYLANIEEEIRLGEALESSKVPEKDLYQLLDVFSANISQLRDPVASLRHEQFLEFVSKFKWLFAQSAGLRECYHRISSLL